MGYGELTNEGKKQEYKLGKMLRKRYNTLLGEIFYTDMIRPLSTDYSRTKMSAQLLLAGLFPPAPSQMWDEDLPWLPVPVEYEKYDEDYLLIRPNKYCTKYGREYKDVLQSNDSISFLKQHHDSLEYISKHAGKEYKTVEDVFGIFHTLNAEYTMNLTLPEWTKRIFPGVVTEFAIKRGELENFTPSMRKLNGGRVLQQVVKHMVAKSKNILEPSRRKMYLYSGHDYNVVNILKVLNLFEPHFPNYSSSVVIELHHFPDKNDYAVKILHSKSAGEDYEEKQLNGCEVMCPLETFLNITQKLVPANYTIECESSFTLD
ncbi:venom acid phosphatase Acph-1 isoform X2 [Leptinotarsa decemlineata]